MTPLLIAAGELERIAAVVFFVLVAPAHAVSALTGGGLVIVRQAEIFLLQAGDVRREDDAAGVAGPMQAIERGVVFRQIGIAAVAKNAFDKIEIADQTAGHEEARFHGFRFFGACGGADQRAQQQRREDVNLLLLIGGERQRHHIGRRLKGCGEQLGKGDLGNGDFVGRDGQAAFDDVKDALRGAAVAARIVQHAVAQADKTADTANRCDLPRRASDVTRAKPGRSRRACEAAERGALSPR